MTTTAALERDVAILACAVSAGVHAALTPSHFAEGTAAGVGFFGSTLALAALAITLTLRPSTATTATAAAALAGLIASYAAATSVGVPLLHPEPEPVDALAVATKLVEATGLAASLALLRHGRSAVPVSLRTKGRST